jgi:hypothetical protein
MKRQLSDEQLDTLMRSLLDDAAPDDEIVNNVADSPALWWGVQRQIAAAKDGARAPWPPKPKLWGRGWINLPNLAFAATAAAVLIVSFFILRPAGVPTDIANNVPAASVDETVGQTSDEPVDDVTSGSPDTARDQKHVRLTGAVAGTQRRLARPTTSRTAKSTREIKTDFIALSYARSPESGQIVRVKVPSSMMVSLGLVATVAKPSALVDAEVVVGDDGLTRAIRFIR